MDSPAAFFRSYTIRKLAGRLGAEFGTIKDKPHIARSLEEEALRLKNFAREDAYSISALREQIGIAYKTSRTSDEAISKMYDAVYGEAGGPHYRYSSVLLTRAGLEYVSGNSMRDLKPLRIIDIGAGNAELLRFLRDSVGISKERLWGCDISRESSEIINREGFNGYCGRIDALQLPRDNFDVVFLSYFIDYDMDQEATFGESIKITKSGGRIILEGLFPCRSFGILEDGNEKHNFVTKGKSAAGDIALVCGAFQELAPRLGKKVLIEKLIAGWRHIYNDRGMNKLPSYFIVMRVV
jgi:ubiquinone/menaquinone biosynthesis C-methylase UbiE